MQKRGLNRLVIFCCYCENYFEISIDFSINSNQIKKSKNNFLDLVYG